MGQYPRVLEAFCDESGIHDGARACAADMLANAIYRVFTSPFTRVDLRTPEMVAITDPLDRFVREPHCQLQQKGPSVAAPRSASIHPPKILRQFDGVTSHAGTRSCIYLTPFEHRLDGYRYTLVPSMPNRPCPSCGKTGRFLEDSSEIAHVDYYRCDPCGQVWVLDRYYPDKPPRLVTQPKDPNLV